MKKLEDWIDYLEGEVSLRERTEMNLLLKHSLSDQTILDNLRRLRQAVYESDMTRSADKLLADRQYLEKLQSQVMKEVKKAKIAEAGHLTVISVNASTEDAALASESGRVRSRGIYRT